MKLLTGLILVLGLAACGPIRNLEKMVGTTDEMKDQTIQLNKTTRDMKEETKALNAGMIKTNNSTHLFALVTAMKELNSKENTEQLSPPALMMLPAFAFTKEAEPHEIMETFHMLWNDTVYGAGDQKDNPDATAEEAHLRRRKVSRAAAGAIAGFTPREKFNQIVADEITNRGDYEGSAYAFAAARFEFIREWLYEPKVKKAKGADINLKLVKKALDYYTDLKQITSFPFLDRLDFNVEQFIETTDPKDPMGKRKVLVAQRFRVQASDLVASARGVRDYLEDNLPPAMAKNPEMKALISQMK